MRWPPKRSLACVAMLAVLCLHARAAEPEQPASPDAGFVDESAFELSKDPSQHQWRLTSYLKGTPADIKRLLDAAALEAAQKGGAAARQADECAAKASERRAALLKTLHETKQYQQAAADVAKATADLEEARKASDVQRRLSASRQMIKMQGVVTQLEKKVDADPVIKSLEAQRAEELKRVDSLRAAAKKELEWRQKLVDALRFTVTLRAPVYVGSKGILGEVKVLEPRGDGAVVQFPLLHMVRQTVGGGEGITNFEYAGGEVKLVVEDEQLKRARKGTIRLDHTYRVRRVSATDDSAGIVVERVPTDMDYLLDTVREPPDVEKIILAARGGATTQPTPTTRSTAMRR